MMYMYEQRLHVMNKYPHLFDHSCTRACYVDVHTHSHLQPSTITKNGHTFQLTTYKTRTACDLCGKMLWGVIYHGYQCSLCEISLHRYHCISETTAECVGKKSRLRKPSLHKKVNCE